MARLTRREFLRLAGLTATSLALLETGCSPSGSTSKRQASPPTGNQAYLAVAHGADPAAITRAVLAPLGGIERFVKPGQDVIIKPNICVDYHPAEYAATTNPIVVATLVTLCLGAGAKRVRVMDSPFAGISPTSAYAASGIEASVKAAGGEMEVMSPIKFTKVSIPQGKSLTSWKIYQDVLETDVLINVPIAKNHSLARLTLGSKNLLGAVSDPNQIHSSLGQSVADLVSVIRPSLTVVDAYRILMEHGPTGGSLNDVNQANTIIASHDIIAADARGATLFGLTGADIPFIKKGAEMGLGTLDLTSVKVEEVNV
jgi:uncharacterized protein (DUF362 family)